MRCGISFVLISYDSVRSSTRGSVFKVFFKLLVVLPSLLLADCVDIGAFSFKKWAIESPNSIAFSWGFDCLLKLIESHDVFSKTDVSTCHPFRGRKLPQQAPTNSTCFLKKALGALNFRNFSFPNSLGRKLLKLVLPKWRKLTGFFRQLKNFCQSCCLRFLSVPRRSWCSTSRWTSADGRKLLRDESRQVRKFQEHMNTWTHEHMNAPLVGSASSFEPFSDVFLPGQRIHRIHPNTLNPDATDGGIQRLVMKNGSVKGSKNGSSGGLEPWHERWNVWDGYLPPTERVSQPHSSCPDSLHARQRMVWRWIWYGTCMDLYDRKWWLMFPNCSLYRCTVRSLVALIPSNCSGPCSVES